MGEGSDNADFPGSKVRVGPGGAGRCPVPGGAGGCRGLPEAVPGAVPGVPAGAGGGGGCRRVPAGAWGMHCWEALLI